MIRLNDMRRRVARLEEVSLGFMKEQVAWKDVDHPLTGPELREYQEAIGRVVQALGQARVALAQACRRLEGS